MKSKFHSGEIAVQTRAGVRDSASRVAGVIRSTLPLVVQDFLTGQRMVILATLDVSGRVRVFLLTGEPRFIWAVDERTVRIDAQPVVGDPLGGNLKSRDEIGILVIEFASRRRMKVKGKAQLKEDGIYIHTESVYALCPKYIQTREIVANITENGVARNIQHVDTLTEKQRNWIAQADTFFIASFHPETGADASHRGGYPGFIRVLNTNKLVFPDYPGNNMFNTLGNISVNPNAGLLFIDFERGGTLQVTGQAEVIWDENRVTGFAGAERLVGFEIEQVIEITGANGLHWEFIEYSPFNLD